MSQPDHLNNLWNHGLPNHPSVGWLRMQPHEALHHQSTWRFKSELLSVDRYEGNKITVVILDSSLCLFLGSKSIWVTWTWILLHICQNSDFNSPLEVPRKNLCAPVPHRRLPSLFFKKADIMRVVGTIFQTVKMTSATHLVHPQSRFKHQGKWIHALFLTQRSCKVPMVQYPGLQYHVLY